MIVVAILAIIGAIGVPNYLSAVRVARVGKAKHELVTLSSAIDSYRATYGHLPLSLYQIGFGGKTDPWGMPYCYLNYEAGTGDGLEWAIELGLLDPASFGPVTQTGGGGDGGVGDAVEPPPPQGPPNGRGPRGPQGPPNGHGPQGQQGPPNGWNQNAQGLLIAAMHASERSALRRIIRDQGDFSFFTGVPKETTRRRDRYMFPLNTDYDLFSSGPDARTTTSLGSDYGLDDVIRANNGAYFGTAEDY